MIRAAFIDLLKQLFPPIKEETKEQIKILISQFEKRGGSIFVDPFFPPLCQGDIISNIPFLTLQEEVEGKPKYQTGRMYGMLLSTSCDIENDEVILIAPTYNIDFYIDSFDNDKGSLGYLRENLILDKF